MKITEFKNKDKKELSQMLSELKTQMAKLIFELEAHTLKNTSEIGKTKKDIARIMTVLGQLKS